MQDKLALFRQQASIIAHKKDDAMESYKAVGDEVEAAERELATLRAQLESAGDRVSHTASPGASLCHSDHRSKFNTPSCMTPPTLDPLMSPSGAGGRGVQTLRG